MKALFIICFFLSLLCCVLTQAAENAPTVPEWFQAGNQLYEKGDFRRAVELYYKVVDAGFVNEAVYYNLANALYKDDQLGKAILYYEKARRLAPRDLEIVGNLTLGRSRIVDKVDAPPEVFGVRQLHWLHSRMSLDLETLLAAGLFVAGNCAFSIFLLSKRDRLRTLALSSSLGIFCLFIGMTASLAFRIYEFQTLREGIVLTTQVDVLSGPGTENPTLFSIHEGLPVRIQNELGEWIQIGLENGWNGWVKHEAVGVI
jgi:tetratricopeptide (TPR) repeat protein